MVSAVVCEWIQLLLIIRVNTAAVCYSQSGRQFSGSMASSAVSEYSSSSSPGFLRSIVLPSDRLVSSLWKPREPIRSPDQLNYTIHLSNHLWLLEIKIKQKTLWFKQVYKLINLTDNQLDLFISKIKVLVHIYTCVCVCVCGFMWFMRTQICIMTWVWQRYYNLKVFYEDTAYVPVIQKA